MTCKWLVLMVIVSPQHLDLWDPFHSWPFVGLLNGGDPTETAWDDPPSNPGPHQVAQTSSNIYLVKMGVILHPPCRKLLPILSSGFFRPCYNASFVAMPSPRAPCNLPRMGVST